MITEIGLASGKILILLEEQGGPVSVSEIEKHLDEPLEILYMSLGALVREGAVHVNFEDDEYYAKIIDRKTAHCQKILVR